MAARYGGQNMVDPIRRVLVRPPDEAFGSADPETWHYTSTPDLQTARREHQTLVQILMDAGAEILYHQQPQLHRADAIYVFDPVLITDSGAVILRMGKELRRGEEEAIAATLKELEIPILANLSAGALAEGGDLLWLDETHLVAGLGFRTNRQGLRQLQEILSPLGVRVTGVDLPFFTGPEACLHLLSMISLIDHDLALVFPPLLPVALWQELETRQIRQVEVPEEEFPTMGPNVLALAPRRCLMLEGNPRTQERLEAAGCTVQTYRGQEISLKAEGGPTCLTRPLLRAV